MPIGSFHDETGILISVGDRLYLQRDAGGRWEIDAPDKVMVLLDRRVRLLGVRTGFDRLSAKQVSPV